MPIYGTCKVCGGETIDYGCVKCESGKARRLQEQVDELVKGHPKCPVCKGSGKFQDSTDGGVEVQCDCAANIYLQLVEAEKVIESVREGIRIIPGRRVYFREGSLDAVWKSMVAYDALKRGGS